MRDQINRKISAREQRFVTAYCKLGGINGQAAATAAGYGAAGAHVAAHRLLKRSHVLAAITAETEKFLRAGVALGAATLAELVGPDNPPGVRLQAANSLMDRGGLRLATLSEHRVVIEDHRTNNELLENIKQLSKELGLDAKLISGDTQTKNKRLPSVTIDAEFADVLAPAGTNAGTFHNRTENNDMTTNEFI